MVQKKSGNKKKTLLIWVVITIFTSMLLGACSTTDRDTTTERPELELDYRSFEGTEIGVITGVLTYLTTEKIGGIPVYYQDSTSAMEDVRNERIKGYMHALSAVQVMASETQGFQAVPIPAEIFSAEIGAISMNQDVIDAFNLFLESQVESGMLGDMQNRWFGDNFDANLAMPEIDNSGTEGSFTVAIAADSIPYVFIGPGGQYSGFSIELALRFGAYFDKDIHFVDMAFGGLIPYIRSEKADLGIANMAITEERKESVLFTDPFFYEQHGVLVLSHDSYETSPAQGENIILATLRKNLITDQRWQLILSGLGVTLLISICAMVLGTVWGSILCYILSRRNKTAGQLARLYCNFIYGTPMVVLLLVIYYIVFRRTHLSGVTVAIIAFALMVGAPIAQNLKRSIDHVSSVEIQAARSLGFSQTKTFLHITLPQAIGSALPGYSRSFIELVKSTAIVGFIAVQDLTRAADLIRSRTFSPYFPLLFITAIYLIIVAFFVTILNKAVKRVQKGVPE